MSLFPAIAVVIVFVLAGAIIGLRYLAETEAKRLKSAVLCAPKTRPAAPLPGPVAAAVQRFGPVPEGAVALRIGQTGEMRLSPKGAWLPFSAEQIYALDAVAFVWDAWVTMMPGVKMRVLDAYDGTRGLLSVRLWGLLRVMGAQGADIERAEAQRYIAELAWNPAALKRNGALVVTPQDEATYTVHVERDPHARVDLTIAGDGTIAHVQTRARPMRVGKTVAEKPWRGVFSGWGTVGPFELPRRGRISWHHDQGHHEYWRGDIRKAVFLDTQGQELAS